MAFSLNTLHTNTHSIYRWCVTRLQVGLSLENERETADELAERSEEYAAWLDVFEHAVRLNDANDGAFEVFINHFGESTDDATDLESACEAFESAYIGVKTPAEYAEDYVDESGMLADVPELIKNHIDYEGIGRDMVLGGDITEIDEYLFHSNW